MDRDKLLLMEDKNFLRSTLNMIFRKNPKSFKSELIKAIDLATKELRDQGVEREVVNIFNKRAGTKLNSVGDLKKTLKLIESEEQDDEDRLDEKSAFSEWWSEAKSNAYGALAFYPMLTMFLELDKVIKGTADASLRTVIIYLLIWVMVIAGKIEHKDIIKRKADKSWQNLSGNPYDIA